MMKSDKAKDAPRDVLMAALNIFSPETQSEFAAYHRDLDV